MKRAGRIGAFLLGLANAAALAALVMDSSGWMVKHCAWLARLQFMPAVLGADAAALMALTVLTLWRGRLYCETLCPLGIWQEVLRLIAFKRARRVCSRLPEPPAQRWVRWCVFGAVALSIAGAGLFGCVSLGPKFDPYAIFLRAAAWGCEPNVSVIVAIGSFAGIALVSVLAFLGQGRIWCNWVCPVGTLLHALARLSPHQDAYDKCAGCGRCGKCLKK